MIKRIFDIVLSSLGLIVLSPLLLVVALWIKLDTKGPVFYKQIRVGKNNKDFQIIKFRSMRVNTEKGRLITIGQRDPRITSSGYYIRKYKLDELPQLINVLKGDMSFVGPRPEVQKYVALYNKEQQKVLSVKPGITDIASIKYKNENELLAAAKDPDKTYIETIMPDKLKYNLDYIEQQSFLYDLKIILKTIKEVVIK